MSDALTARSNRNIIFLVIVASLGYFVDIYDLLIFSIVRKESLLAIGVSPGDVLSKGIHIINFQMLGLIIGGVLWGVTGDKLGRIKVLFGSILLYSIANFANGFVHDVETYAIIRFIGGIGLAGELGAGITLVSETMSKENRGYGTMIVAAVGLCGTAAAVIVAKYGWRQAYFVGGGLGIILLFLRMGTFESGMFKSVENTTVSKGNFFMLLNNWSRFKKYLYSILIAAPSWFLGGVLITLSPEFGKALGAKQVLSAGDGLLYDYLGVALGGILSGLFAQATRSRKLTMLIFLILSAISVIIFLRSTGLTSQHFFWLCFFIGCASGYIPTFLIISAEQFGTNIRSTVATTAPNFVRGLLIPINWAFIALKDSYGMINSAFMMIVILTSVALFSLSQLNETFGKDLDYIETDEKFEPSMVMEGN